MGFHLVDKVYFNVTGTSPTAQAVLAYLAHRSDDNGVRKCYPSTESIEAATHFKHTAIRGALNELRERELLKWKSGGRLKGEGGKALANEYEFNLPSTSAKSISRETANAVAAKRPKHTPPDGLSISRQTATITQDHPKSHPSVITVTEAPTEDLKKEFKEVAKNWSVKREQEEASVKAESQNHQHYLFEVVNEAMRVCRVSDSKNRQIFSSTLCRWTNLEDALQVIRRFESEMNAGEHTNLRNPAAKLNSALTKESSSC